MAVDEHAASGRGTGRHAPHPVPHNMKRRGGDDGIISSRYYSGPRAEGADGRRVDESNDVVKVGRDILRAMEMRNKRQMCSKWWLTTATLAITDVRLAIMK